MTYILGTGLAFTFAYFSEPLNMVIIYFQFTHKKKNGVSERLGNLFKVILPENDFIAHNNYL